MVQGTRLKAKMEAYWPQGLTRSEPFLLKMLFAASALLSMHTMTSSVSFPAHIVSTRNVSINGSR
jgi:hypothetical protein